MRTQQKRLIGNKLRQVASEADSSEAGREAFRRVAYQMAEAWGTEDQKLAEAYVSMTATLEEKAISAAFLSQEASERSSTRIAARWAKRWTRRQSG